MLVFNLFISVQFSKTNLFVALKRLLYLITFSFSCQHIFLSSEKLFSICCANHLSDEIYLNISFNIYTFLYLYLCKISCFFCYFLKYTIFFSYWYTWKSVCLYIMKIYLANSKYSIKTNSKFDFYYIKKWSTYKCTSFHNHILLSLFISNRF